MLLLPSSLTVSPLALYRPYQSNPFSSFDFLFKIIFLFRFSSENVLNVCFFIGCKKLESTEIHQVGNNNGPDSQYSRVNDCSSFGLSILSLSLFLVYFNTLKNEDFSRLLRTVGTTT